MSNSMAIGVAKGFELAMVKAVTVLDLAKFWVKTGRE